MYVHTNIAFNIILSDPFPIQIKYIYISLYIKCNSIVINQPKSQANPTLFGSFHLTIATARVFPRDPRTLHHGYAAPAPRRLRWSWSPGRNFVGWWGSCCNPPRERAHPFPFVPWKMVYLPSWMVDCYGKCIYHTWILCVLGLSPEVSGVDVNRVWVWEDWFLIPFWIRWYVLRLRDFPDNYNPMTWGWDGLRLSILRFLRTATRFHRQSSQKKFRNLLAGPLCNGWLRTDTSTHGVHRRTWWLPRPLPHAHTQLASGRTVRSGLLATSSLAAALCSRPPRARNLALLETPCQWPPGAPCVACAGRVGRSAPERWRRSARQRRPAGLCYPANLVGPCARPPKPGTRARAAPKPHASWFPRRGNEPSTRAPPATSLLFSLFTGGFFFALEQLTDCKCTNNDFRCKHVVQAHWKTNALNAWCEH